MYVTIEMQPICSNQRNIKWIIEQQSQACKYLKCSSKKKQTKLIVTFYSKKSNGKIDKKWFQSHTFIFVYKTSALKALKKILLSFLPRITTTSNKLELNKYIVI